jgi:hypothetical protein
MSTSISTPTPAARPVTATATGSGAATSSAANLALAVNVASGLASDVSATLHDVLGKGAGGADAASLVRLHAATSALDVWTDAASALAKVDSDKKKQVAGQI